MVNICFCGTQSSLHYASIPHIQTGEAWRTASLTSTKHTVSHLHGPVARALEARCVKCPAQTIRCVSLCNLFLKLFWLTIKVLCESQAQQEVRLKYKVRGRTCWKYFRCKTIIGGLTEGWGLLWMQQKNEERLLFLVSFHGDGLSGNKCEEAAHYYGAYFFK